MNVELAQRIHASGKKAFFAIAGGGQSFIGEFTKIAGASQTLIGALVPYHQTTFNKFIGGTVRHYVSEEAARKLAVASYAECLKAGVSPKDALGFGVSASIAKDNEREGREHKMFLAVHSHEKTMTESLILQQGRTRLEEETLFCRVIECMLANITNENLSISTQEYPLQGYKLQAQETYNIDTAYRPSLFKVNIGKDHLPLVIYPGSFNPMHDAHREIYRLSYQILGVSPILELCLDNTDKPSIDYIEVKNRIKTMKGLPVVLTDTPTFKEKVDKLSELYSNNKLIFIVGADTWNRIWDEKYAGSLLSLECRWIVKDVKFLVFSRNNIPFINKFGWGETLRIKDARAENFQMAMSSTDIRNQI